MALFFESRNNGVIAVIRSDDAAVFGTVTQSGGDPFKVGVKVFTFCDPERFQDPTERMAFTGDYALLKDLLTMGCHTLERQNGQCGWQGFVPFSNQEHRQYPDGDWKKCVTTTRDVLDKFQISGK
jgi:hypothetical protein